MKLNSILYGIATTVPVVRDVCNFTYSKSMVSYLHPLNSCYKVTYTRTCSPPVMLFICTCVYMRVRVRVYMCIECALQVVKY